MNQKNQNKNWRTAFFNFKTIGISLSMLLFYVNANAQKKAWHLFQPNADCKNISFTSSTIALGTNFKKCGSFNDYFASNVQTDVNGKVLFTVINTGGYTYIYDRNNQAAQSTSFIGNSWAGWSREISIVAIDEGVRYHIISGDRIIEYSIANNSFENPISTGATILDGINFLTGNINFKITTGAISKVISNDGCKTGYRYYYLGKNLPGQTSYTIKMIEYTKGTDGENIVNCTGRQPQPLFSTTSKTVNDVCWGGSSSSFIDLPSEFEISNDGTKIAFASSRELLVYNINSNGTVGSLFKSYAYNCVEGSFQSYQANGIEFEDNNSLVFNISRLDGTNLSADERVFRWDLTTSNPTLLMSNTEFAKTSIEKGKNGRLYFAQADGLYYLNTSVNPPFTKDLNFTYPKSMQVISNGKTFFNLPDQIDGIDNEFLNLDEIVFNFTTPAGTLNWTNASHGFTPKGNGKVYVINAINAANNTVLNLDGINFEFYNNAVFNLQNQAKVQLKGCELKGYKCELMWKGIDMLWSNNSTNNSSLKILANPLRRSSISDAYTAINSPNTNQNMEINGCNFSANENNIKMSNKVSSNVKIYNNSFEGYTPLRNQCAGSYTTADPVSRTTNHIITNNCEVTIGKTGNGQNIFNYAEFGLKSTASNIELDANYYKNVRQIAVSYNANSSTKKNFKSFNCWYQANEKGIKMENNAGKCIIQKCSLWVNKTKAIEFTNNKGGDLLVGHETDVTLKNTFVNNKGVDIECYNNGKYDKNNSTLGTYIKIYYNTINNNQVTNNIVISEPSKSARSFELLKIVSNTLNATNTAANIAGITCTNITGANLPKSTLNGVNYTVINHNTNFEIIGNTINFKDAYGINTSTSSKLNFINNTVTGNNDTNLYRSTAICLSNAADNMVYNNTLKAHIGLALLQNNMMSNHYCNTFNMCRTGIGLWQANVLRNVSNLNANQHNDDMIHGHLITGNSGTQYPFARPNAFTAAYGTNIAVHTSLINQNQWDLTRNGFTPVPTTNQPSVYHNYDRLNTCNLEVVIKVVTPVGGGGIVINPALPLGMQWQLKYYTNRSHITDSTPQYINDNGVNKVIQIENEINLGNYSVAQSTLNSFAPANSIEQDFKTVYGNFVYQQLQAINTLSGSLSYQIDTIWQDSITFAIDTLYNDTIMNTHSLQPLNDSIVNILGNIAAQDGIVSPAAYSARAILWAERQLIFADPKAAYMPNIQGVVSSNCNGGNIANLPVHLQNNMGINTAIHTLTDSFGRFILTYDTLKNLDTTQAFRLAVNVGIAQWQYTPYTTWQNLAQAVHHQFTCAGGGSYSVGINQLNENNSIKLYPNPTNGVLNISGMADESYINIIDITGRKVLSSQTDATQVQLNIKHLDKGIYTVIVYNTIHKTETKHKLIVQ